MPRIARIIAPGLPHHVCQRGNNHQPTFQDNADRKKYLELLSHYLSKYHCGLMAYCLMDNHVHLLLNPPSKASMSKTMQCVSLCYTQYYNAKYGRSGRLWECRYHSCVVDTNRYLWNAGCYIEQNPVRAGIVKNAADYLYSSAAAHITGIKDPVINRVLFDKDDLKSYREMLGKPLTKEHYETIRRCTRLGKPAGESKFIEKIAALLGRDKRKISPRNIRKHHRP